MKALYDSKSKSIVDNGMRALLSESYKIQTWLDVEAALALAQGEVGIIPKEDSLKIAEKCTLDNIDMAKLEKLKSEIGHGFVPFVKVLTQACGEQSGKFVHYGVTTQNIQQTGQLLQLKQFSEKMKEYVVKIIHNLADLAEEHKETIMVGRTHGKHALPITYGYKVAVWIDELTAALQRMQEAEKRVFTVMMGGAVGGFHAMGKEGIQVQALVAQRLGMYPMGIPSRNSRVYRLEWAQNLALLATTFNKIAEEVYYTSIEEFFEVSESVSKNTVGSSTMPQKINPKLSKGIIANSQKLYSVISAMYNAASRPFEADSSAYFLYDNCLQEAAELMAEIIIRAEELSGTIRVNKARMLENAKLSGGLINSEHIMMSMAAKLGKDKAHTLIHDIAMASQMEKVPFLELLTANTEILKHFSAERLKEMISPQGYVGLCAYIAEEYSRKGRIIN